MPSYSVQPYILPLKFALNLRNIQLVEAALSLNGDCRCHAGALPGDGATHHIAGGGMTDPVATRDPAGTDQIPDALG